MKGIERIVVVGSGNLAESLAAAVAGCPDVELAAVAARNRSRGEYIAGMCSCACCGGIPQAPAADLYIIAVSDRAVAEAARMLPAAACEAIVVHTSGATPMDVLARFGRRGVLYPLQTFTAGRRVDFGAVPLFVEGSDGRTASELEAFARMLSRRVARADSEQRRAVHLAGVFACNFANHMYVLGERVMRRAGFGFDMLRPIISETAAKAVEASSPADVQTGPAVRGDTGSQKRHLELLAGDDASSEIYKRLSENIWEISRKI